MKRHLKIFWRLPVLAILLLLMFPGILHATTDQPVYQRLDGRLGQLIPSVPLQTVDLIYENISTRNRIDLTKPQVYNNVISLYIDEKNASYIPSDFACEVTFNVSYTNTSVVVTPLSDQKLNVNYSKSEGVKFYARK